MYDILKYYNVWYIKILQLLSVTAGVKGKFFIVKIILMRYSFVLICFINFESIWRDTIQILPSVFPSYPIHSVSVLYSKMAVQMYIHKISKQIDQTFIQ